MKGALRAARPARAGVFSKAAACGLALVLQHAACAQSGTAGDAFPARPLKVIVSSSAGSSPDLQARLFTQKMSERHGYTWVIDNVPGASGNIAADRVAKAAPDGYTLLVASAGPLYFNRALYGKLPYDILRDFEPVTQIANTPNILALFPGVQVKSVRELIAYAKANPGKLRFGSPGSGSSQHLSGALFESMAGVQMQHIPYKSSSQMTAELTGGQFELAFQNAPLILPFVKTGKVRALAVTSRARLVSAPDLPTIAESGLPGYEVGGGTGLLAPRGTPVAVVRKLEADAREAISSIHEQYSANGLVAVGGSAVDFATNLKSENARWAPVIKATGAQVD
ncbi:MAG: bug [Bradyrhizobium sp.]|nr:bug [Bradyrhizobium sp.]